MEGIDILQTREIHEVDSVYFIGPIIVGILLLVLMLMFSLIIRKHHSLMLFLGIVSTFLCMAISWILVVENPKVVGKDITITTKNKKSLKALIDKYPDIEKVDTYTYVIHIREGCK